MNLLKAPITDRETMLKLIPQRPPIVMVDTLYHFSEKKVVAGLTVTNQTMFVQNGYLTEPGLIEHMAQSVALYTGYHYYIKNIPAPEGYIGAIKGVNIEKLPEIDDVLETQIDILQEVMGVNLVKGITRLNGDIIVSAQMKTVIKK